ncbi:MAG: sugar ABC transporter permease, partial [Patulibacter sp.]|nr:sugar ABC transporter permease [Patulibacter sp.]
MSAASSTPGSGPGPEARDPHRWGRRLTSGIFLGPAVLLLLVWLVYPTLSTIKRSFFDRSGDHFVWFANYKQIFTTDTLVKALENNALWVAVVPALVTAIGLILAVLVDKIKWQVAFRLAIFMPMAISLFAAG